MKNHFIVLVTILQSISFPVFLLTGYIALYYAWVSADMESAMLYLPWARNFGMLSVTGAAMALVILFFNKIFSIPPKTRLWLSLLATITIAFFAEFRNEGKFYFNYRSDMVEYKSGVQTGHNGPA